MKRILIVCVSYNSYKVLYEYIRSIDVAAKEALDIAEVVVAIADNTYENFEDILPEVRHIEIKVFPYHKNWGYMGGIVAVLQDLGRDYVSSFNYVIASNVDLSLSKSFFVSLCRREFAEDVAWIAPSIYRQDKSNENPFQLNRISKIKFNLLIVMYSFPPLYNFYQRLSKSQQKDIKREDKLEEKIIFAGMGSIFIFTRSFMEKAYPLTFPCFMYGEEVYYGELVYRNNMKTLFVPSIEVYDIGAVSTGKLSLKQKCDMNKDSLKTIKQMFNTDKI